MVYILNLSFKDAFLCFVSRTMPRTFSAYLLKKLEVMSKEDLVDVVARRVAIGGAIWGAVLCLAKFVK